MKVSTAFTAQHGWSCEFFLNLEVRRDLAQSLYPAFRMTDV